MSLIWNSHFTGHFVYLFPGMWQLCIPCLVLQAYLAFTSSVLGRPFEEQQVPCRPPSATAPPCLCCILFRSSVLLWLPLFPAVSISATVDWFYPRQRSRLYPQTVYLHLTLFLGIYLIWISCLKFLMLHVFWCSRSDCGFYTHTHTHTHTHTPLIWMMATFEWEEWERINSEYTFNFRLC